MTVDNSREVFVTLTRAEVGALSRQMIHNKMLGGQKYCGLSVRDYNLMERLLDKLKKSVKKPIAASLISSAEAKLSKEEYAAFVSYIDASGGGFG